MSGFIFQKRPIHTNCCRIKVQNCEFPFRNLRVYLGFGKVRNVPTGIKFVSVVGMEP